MAGPGSFPVRGSGAGAVTWLAGGAVATCLLLVLGMIGLIAWHGSSHFWPQPVIEWTVVDDDGRRATLAGTIRDRAGGGAAVEPRILVALTDPARGDERFTWLAQERIVTERRPAAIATLLRYGDGPLHGYPEALLQAGVTVAVGDALDEALRPSLERIVELRQEAADWRRGEVLSVTRRLEQLRQRERRLQRQPFPDEDWSRALAAERAVLEQRLEAATAMVRQIQSRLARDRLRLRLADGTPLEVPLADVRRLVRANSESVVRRLGHALANVGYFLSASPSNANTAGGVFPAIVGTAVMVILMSVIVAPLGIIAAVYLHEYAGQGWVTRTIRVAVSNLAGVPSIVYGVFGLGFLVYVVGGSVDQWLFSDTLPMPTFGTGGVLWAALTLALLTLPVVVVATEEGLSRIPQAVRDGSLALGATRWETTLRVVVPMAIPGMLTGMILAVARAAGEVAPLMLVGVVKLAPALPLDGQFPWLHLERKFMHLGFHIYDLGFQSPNVEAVQPLVYATALLLVVIVLLLNLVAVALRARLRRRFMEVRA